MRAPRRITSSSSTRRDPTPRYGATLDLIAAFDALDLPKVLSFFHDELRGSEHSPEGTCTFSSRAEIVPQLVELFEWTRAAGTQMQTTITNYEASKDATSVIASIDLFRAWEGAPARPKLRGHATVVWRIAEGEPSTITHWRVTWEPASPRGT